MKTTISFIATFIVLCFFNCTGVAQSNATRTVSTFEVGVEKGRKDGTSGLSRTPTRHEAKYSQADRAEFFRGYEAGYNEAIRSGTTVASGQPLTAVKAEGKVKIMEGTRKVSVCTTAMPFVEQTKFIREQAQIVVKSRASHGPATVQLFDTQTGEEKKRILAYEIRDGKPVWAAGMGE